MDKLRQLQQQFQGYILESSPDVCMEIVETPEVSVETRLGIYSNAYSARLIEVLELDFPGLHTLLGDEGYHQMCHAYLAAHPSIYRSVRWFASHLVSFLQSTDPYREYPVLAEMAAFEWGTQHVLDAANGNPVTVAEIGAIPSEKWAQMRFAFHPALLRLDFKWNIVQLWQAVEDETAMPEPTESELPIPWVLWRSADLQILFSSLSVEEAWAMDVMAAGGSFGEMCEGLCEWIDEEHAGLHAATLLKTWLEQGIIVKVL